MIEDGLRTLSAWLCSFVYQVIAWVYELFINISRVEILSSNDIQPIYERVTLILSIIMVFYITFEFVKFVVQPDGVVDKEKGAPKTVIKMIVVVVLIAFVPTIFSLSYKVQNIIFDNQLFSKIILGKQDVNMETFGRDFSANVLSMFYYVDESVEWDNKTKGEKCGDLDCKQIVSLNNEYLRQHGKLPYLTMGLDEKAKATEEKTGENVETYKIYFNGIFAIGVGAFIAYMLILYCIDAGVRVAQMTFLQIIAPIPIIGYLSPKKDGIFQKWLKQCITTYIDLFLRVGIIYFVLLVCQILSKSFSDGTIMENATNATGTMKIFMFIALVMGLLLFAKKAPKMLQELFPSTGAAAGNFGLKAGERVAPMAARTIGAALGGTRALGGLIARGYSRHIRNKANGAKPWFTEDGWKQHEERVGNRGKAKRARRDLRTAQGVQNRVSDDDVNKSKKKVKDAAEAYKKSIGTSDEIQKKKELDNAKNEYRQLMQKRSGITEEQRKARHNFAEKRTNLTQAQKELEAAKATKDQTKIDAAQKKVNQAENEFKNATDAYKKELNSKSPKNSVGQNWADIINSQSAATEAQKKLEEKQQNYNEAVASRDKERITKAQKELELAEQNKTKIDEAFKDDKDRYKNVMTGNVEAQQAIYENAVSQVAEDQNQRHSSVAGAALWGAISGGVTGAATGAKAKTLGEIIPKAKEGWQKDVKNIQQINKFYDNGGATGIQGIADRTVAKVENIIGVDTSYERINLANQKIESNIKELDTSIARVDNVKKEFDATEDRIKSKLDDNKVTATINGPTELKTKSGTIVPISVGTDYGEVNRKYRAQALNAKAISEEASKTAEEKATKLGPNRNAIIAKYENYTGTPSEEEDKQQYQAYQEYIQAKNNADAKAAESVKADRDAKDIEKLTTRAIMTEMLNDPDFENRAGYYDGVAIQSLKRDYNEIKIANQDAELRKSLQQMLKPEDYAAFLNCKFKNYDQMDTVLVALNTVRNALAIRKQTQQDQKNRNISSNRTQAEKAASDYNGSGK